MHKQILLWSSILLSACHKHPPQPVAALPVKVETVSAQAIEQIWRYSGEIRPRTEVRLAFKQAGYVTSLRRVSSLGRSRDIQAGDPVSSGMVLAKLRPTDFLAAKTQQEGVLTTGQGQLEAARAELIRADLAVDRARSLYAAKAMTKPDFDNAVASDQQAHDRLQSTRGQVVTAEGQLRSAEINLADTTLRSPLTAVVESKDVEPGTLVSAGTQAFTLGDMRTPKVVFGVPDTVMSQIKMGAAVPVTVEGFSETPLVGHVTAIGVLANSDARVFNIEVSVPNPNGFLKVGMIADVAVQQSSAPRFLPVIPVDALITTQSGTNAYSVFVISHENGGEIARLRSVRIGEVKARSVVVEQGLQPGDELIVERTNQLQEGRSVKAVK